MLRSMSPSVDGCLDETDVSTVGRELVAKFFRALGDPIRLDLLAFLVEHGEASGTECVERAHLSQGRVSVHLACLVSCGLVSARREGRSRLYRVIDERVHEMLSLGTSMTAEHMASIAACLRVGTPG